MPTNDHRADESDRQGHAEATYERLFGPRDGAAPDNDPELMRILRGFIFGDVFDTGVLDDRTRELDHRDGAGLPAGPAAADVAHRRRAHRRRRARPDP